MLVDISSAVAWLSGIPYEEWPQGRIGVQMVQDPDWCGFGAATQSIIDEVMRDYVGIKTYHRMLSVVMPRCSIKAHRDEQDEQIWRGRIHVPLLSNDKALFMIAGSIICMLPGYTYWIDTRLEHAVFNGGITPRVHLMFDLKNA